MPDETILPKRILIVDDEQSILDCLRMLLESDGYQVETARSGREALTKYSTGKFDVVITDMRMDGMTGAQLAEAIKAKSPNQPIIMISAHENNAPAAVDCLVRKPFALDTLRAALAMVLGK